MRVDKIMELCENLWKTIGLNICFLLSNLPILSFLLFLGIQDIRNYPLFFCFCLLPLGPSLSALFSCILQWKKEKDIRVVYSYIKKYKNNFLQSILVSTIQCTFLYILMKNIIFFNIYFKNFYGKLLFQILITLWISMIPTFYIFIMRYHLTIGNIIKNTLIFLLSRPFILFGNMITLLFSCMIYELFPAISMLVIGSVYGYLILRMNETVFVMMER